MYCRFFKPRPQQIEFLVTKVAPLAVTVGAQIFANLRNEKTAAAEAGKTLNQITPKRPRLRG